MNSSLDARELDQPEIRFISLRRLCILVFTTVLVMWYMLTMLEHVIEAFRTGLSPFQISGPTLAAILVLPAVINTAAWMFYLVSAQYEANIRTFTFGRIVDLLAILQIFYIWVSLGYIFILAAETFSGGGSSSW